MAVRIRLKRLGRKKKPFFRIVAIDSKMRREGAELERLGWYDPLNIENSFSLNEGRIKHWVAVGAVTSHAVKGVFKKAGLSYKWHLEKEGKSQDEIEKLLEEWRTRKAKLKTKTIEIPVEEDEPIEEPFEDIEDESVQVSGESGDEIPSKSQDFTESTNGDSEVMEEPVESLVTDEGVGEARDGDLLELEKVSITAIPSVKFKAVSKLSANLLFKFLSITILSTTTSILCFIFFSNSGTSLIS